MKYIQEFRDAKLIERLARKIKDINPGTDINIMEVCGTHTMSFCRFGLDKLLPKNIKLIAGPGCPVCVSSKEYMDQAIRLSQAKDVIIATFGDMLRIPGSNSSLEKERAKGADINVVYSALDALIIAKENPSKKIVFLAVGFETTAPTYALTILAAKKQKIKNVFFFSSLKTIPAVMDLLLRDKGLNISAFLCPGHVCAVSGWRPYEFVVRKYHKPCCITGFEPLDMLEGIYMLVKMIAFDKPAIINEYIRVVKRGGNLLAQSQVRRVFESSTANWRGLGLIRKSGLRIKKEFAGFDAAKLFKLKSDRVQEQEAANCRCADVLKGKILPAQCPMFGRACVPDNPRGPCMVSQEGACNAYYRYRN